MPADTKIEWSQKTWNPTVGCQAVSPGCKNCYACDMAANFLRDNPDYRGIADVAENGRPYFTGESKLLYDRLDEAGGPDREGPRTGMGLAGEHNARLGGKLDRRRRG